jgi:hypothetical protein|tara:strand:+ start:1186 stop:1428 length:243 start_codon:yes stop_codon:yes gene_type:complete
MTQQEKLDAMVTDLAGDLKPMVVKIEAGIPTTRGNYGRYMGLIQQLGHSCKRTEQVIALSLIEAGADRQGVSDAVKILHG